MTSPAGVPAHLLALDEPAASASPGDGALRSAIVSVARHYLQLARTRTPAEMESLIWQVSSVDGADHGQSCAAFASLTLALGAQAETVGLFVVMFSGFMLRGLAAAGGWSGSGLAACRSTRRRAGSG